MYSGEELTKLRQTWITIKNFMFILVSRSMFQNIQIQTVKREFHTSDQYTKRNKSRWSWPFSLSHWPPIICHQKNGLTISINPEHLLKWMLLVLWWFIQAIVSTGEINQSIWMQWMWTVAKMAHRWYTSQLTLQFTTFLYPACQPPWRWFFPSIQNDGLFV